MPSLSRCTGYLGYPFENRWCSHWTWWIILGTSTIALWLIFSSVGTPDRPVSARGEAHSGLSCWPFYQLPRDMTCSPHLAFLALKRKPAARGKRAPRAPSIVGWLCRLPWRASAAGNIAPGVCPLAQEAA